MASTITLQGTINATQPMLGYRPLAFPSLSTPIFEPAVTMANMILLTILGPPFAWRWNRGSAATTLNCVIGQTDYSVSLGTFGWIEWAAANDLGTSPLWHEMTKLEGLAVAKEQGLPAFISPQYDDGAGNITFRVMPVPDAAYPINMDIQQKPTLFAQAADTTGLQGTWSSIPDEYSHLYTWGFQALALLLAGDQRFAEINSKFVNALLSTHQGLTEVQRNAFLNNWHSTTGSQIVLQDKLTQGIQARAV
jgi:hypothetical protein